MQWSSKEIAFLSSNLTKTTNNITSEFFSKFGHNRSPDGIMRKINRLRVENGIAINKPHSSFNKSDILEWIQDLQEAGQRIKKPKRVKQNLGGETAAVLFLSDFHFGKQNNNYNLDLASERVNQIPEMLSDLLPEDPGQVHICLMGDIVDGEDIYPTHSTHIEASAIKQVQSVVPVLQEMIISIRDIMDTQVVVHTVPGNHGRISKSANELSNWDNVVYYVLNLVLQGERNIFFNLNFDEFHSFKVLDKNGLINHRGVKHAGTPAMQIKLAGWDSMNDENLSFFGHGHWHTYGLSEVLGMIVVSNGSLCGPDDLAQRIAKNNQPKQAFLYIEEGKPISRFGTLEW